MRKKILLLAALTLMLLALAGCGNKISVETGEVSGITDNDAIVSGLISEYKEMPTNIGVFFGESEDSMEKIIRDTSNGGLLQAPKIDVKYDITIDGDTILEPEKTYYYQFFARVDGKDVLGEIKSFTTRKDMPEADVSVESGEVTEITDSNAVIHSTLSNYEVKPDETGVYIGESPDTLKKEAKNVRPLEEYDFSEFKVWYTINTDTDLYLKPETTYYYQCYAKIGDTEKRGEIKSFTTAAAPAPTPAETAAAE